MTEWRNGGMAEWRNGGMVEWQNGRMAEWHNVWYKIVRNQDTESTQMPPWKSPSWLVPSLIFLLRGAILRGSIFFVRRQVFMYKTLASLKKIAGLITQ